MGYMAFVSGVQVLKVMAKKLVRKCLEMLRKLATVEVDLEVEVRVREPAKAAFVVHHFTRTS